MLLGAIVCMTVARLRGGAQPAAPWCDPALRTDQRDHLRYRGLQDRCEGRYIVNRSGITALNVISFTEGRRNFDPAALPRVTVRWPLAADSATLRIESISGSTYYRLDSRLPPRSVGFSWPATVLSELHLRGAELGFLATTESPGGAGTLLLPVRIVDSVQPGVVSPYEMIVVPGLRLVEIYATVRTPTGQVVSPRTALRQVPYAAGRAIRYILPAGLDTGIYRVQFEAIHAKGRSVAERRVQIR